MWQRTAIFSSSLPTAMLAPTGRRPSARRRRQKTSSPSAPSACLSFNYHRDHFGQIWGLRQADGQVAHTGCVGFGLERMTLALLYHHGLDPSHWPEDVRDVLEIAA